MSEQSGILAGALALVLGAGLLAFGLQPYGVFLLSLWAVYTIGAIGLNLTLGYAGQVSLAQASFVGIGAYTTAILMPHGVPFGLTLLLGGGLCFGLGVLLGFPALRVQGHYLAFVTLALAIIAFLVFRNEAWLTGGIYGIDRIRRPDPFTGAIAYLWLCLLVLALVTFGAWWMLRSPWGRAFVALRENPVRAASLGVEVRTYTLLAFAIGAALGGVSGSLYASLVQFIEPTPFALTLSFSLLLMVVVGGSGSFLGPYLGALVAVLLPEWLRFLHDYYLLIYGVLVILLLAFCPEGLVGLASRGGPPLAFARGTGAGAAMTVVLEARDLHKSFGGVRAVNGVSFQVEEGEILGVIGPNGSGKSTLFNCLLGQLPPTSGRVLLDGQDVTGMPPAALNRRGVSRTFQLLQVFPQLSARENLILAGQEHVGSRISRLFGRPDSGLGAAADRMLEMFRLEHVAALLAGGLSYGQQKLLDAAMAFMAGPRLVLLDEPAGGVNLTLLGAFRERLRAMNAEGGSTFVVIEHNMDFVMSLCTRVICIAEGQVIANGSPEDVRNDPIVIEAYLGH